jgi:hypothetical protein
MNQVGGHVSGLLNLAALAVALTLAYLGIDKVDPQRGGISRGEHLAAEFKKEMERRVADFMIRLDLRPASDQFLFRLLNWWDRARLRFLIHLSTLDFGRVERNPINLAVRLWYAPFPGYFSRRIDAIVVGIMALIALGLFLTMSGATAWYIPNVDNFPFSHLAFWTLTAIVVLTLLHTMALYRVRDLGETVQRMGPMLLDKVKAKFDHLSKQAMLSQINEFMGPKE